MKTQELIDVIKTHSHNRGLVSIKYAVFSRMKELGLNTTEISKITGYTRSNIIYGMNTFSDLLDTNDVYANIAKEELTKHKISIGKQIYTINNNHMKINHILYIDDIKFN